MLNDPTARSLRRRGRLDPDLRRGTGSAIASVDSRRANWPFAGPRVASALANAPRTRADQWHHLPEPRRNSDSPRARSSARDTRARHLRSPRLTLSPRAPSHPQEPWRRRWSSPPRTARDPRTYSPKERTVARIPDGRQRLASRVGPRWASPRRDRGPAGRPSGASGAARSPRLAACTRNRDEGDASASTPTRSSAAGDGRGAVAAQGYARRGDVVVKRPWATTASSPASSAVVSITGQKPLGLWTCLAVAATLYSVPFGSRGGTSHHRAAPLWWHMALSTAMGTVFSAPFLLAIANPAVAAQAGLSAVARASPPASREPRW